MSESSWIPKTWPEAIPYIAWGVLAFAFGFEGVGALIHGEWWPAAFGIGGLFGLTAMLIHWARIKQTFASPGWLVAAMMLALTVVVFSPFVEQRRWPYSSAGSIPPTVTEQKPSISVPAASPAQPHKFYTQGDKERIGELCYTITNLLNQKGADIAQKENSLIGAWSSQTLDHLRIPNVSGLSAVVQDLTAATRMLKTALYDDGGFIKSNQSYSNELNSVIDADGLNIINKLLDAEHHATDAVSAMELAVQVLPPGNPSLAVSIANLSKPHMESLVAAERDFTIWKKLSLQRADKLRLSLAQ